jgi:sec-independent protein translocase protein TatA
MFGLSLGHLLVVLAIVLLLFGPKRLKTLGSDLGTAIKGFRSAIKEAEEPPPAAKERIIEGELQISPRKADAPKHDTNV